MPKPKNHLLPLALVLVMLSLLQNLMAAAGWNVNNIDVTDGQDEARTVFCKGETVKLTVTDTCSSTAKRSYSWSPGGSTNNPLILTNLNAGNYIYTVTVTIGGESGQASAGFTVVQVASISTNSNFSATTYPIYVGSNTTIKFYAKPSPVGQWPAGKPAWGGVASGSGSDQATIIFNASGTNYVTAECGNTVTATVVVLKVELTPSAVNATESLDSGTFTCTVTPSGLSPTYQWLTGSDNDAWPATAGNDPELDYSASTASATIVNGTRWFALTPSRRQVIDGVTCSYNVNCEVTVGGTKCRASTPATLSVTVNMTGQTTGCVFQSWDTITVAQTSGLWNVTGQGNFSRSAPAASVNMPATSQFHDKAMVHENKHVEQWMTGMFKDLKDANALYNSTLSTLTSTNSEADLRDKILYAVWAKSVSDDEICNSKTCDAEKEAFDAMNAVDPDFLELDDADWKPLYGCQ